MNPAIISRQQKNYLTILTEIMYFVKAHSLRFRCGISSHSLLVHKQSTITYYLKTFLGSVTLRPHQEPKKSLFSQRTEHDFANCFQQKAIHFEVWHTLPRALFNAIMVMSRTTHSKSFETSLQRMKLAFI